MVEKAKKAKKVEKWKTIKIPESVWILIKIEAAKKGVKIYEEVEYKYDKGN